RAEAELGPLDLLVANAGLFAAGGRLWETDPDTWWRDVEVDLRGPALALWAALPAMVARGRGRVVVLGSGFGTAPTPGASAYASAKAGVARLVDTVAAELEGTGVTVLAVSPGMVATDMTSSFPARFSPCGRPWSTRRPRPGRRRMRSPACCCASPPASSTRSRGGSSAPATTSRSRWPRRTAPSRARCGSCPGPDARPLRLGSAPVIQVALVSPLRQRRHLGRRATLRRACNPMHRGVCSPHGPDSSSRRSQRVRRR
ncbi:MAG: SDR family oxidoreductase, partial [Actinomycetota bacterium]|nr:SDR family oxidoreductase [Actinomycetota bacterium]